MNAPDKDGWIEWSGGEGQWSARGDGPIPRQIPFEIRRRDGSEDKIDDNVGFRWRHNGGAADIVAYRVTAVAGLYAQPEPDGFTHESPIRAFTDWTVNGRYAIGKGFRPSLQHLTVYLDAMERLEGWEMRQILEAASGSPSFVFRRSDVREVRCFLSDFVACTDLSEPAADGGITVGMVFQQHAESLLKSRMGL